MAETKAKTAEPTAAKRPAAKKVAAKDKVARTLLANEIECRIGTIKENGCSLLLYKDARVDMRLLDEVYGPLNWKRQHELINGNLFCTISIYDDEKGEWVSKQDVGTESATEKEKGQASDAFKRAAFNWGIGRELYTAPFVWVVFKKGETFTGRNGNIQTYTKFSVQNIEYNEAREISKLVIVDHEGTVRFTFPKGVEKKKAEAPAKTKGVFTGAQLKQAVAEANSCISKDDVNAVWAKYEDMQNDAEFRHAIQKKCEELKR